MQTYGVPYGLAVCQIVVNSQQVGAAFSDFESVGVH